VNQSEYERELSRLEREFREIETALTVEPNNPRLRERFAELVDKVRKLKQLAAEVESDSRDKIMPEADPITESGKITSLPSRRREIGGFRSLTMETTRQVPPGRRLREFVRAYIHLEDPWVVDVALATIVCNMQGGDPVWVLLVNPASTAKTELVQIFNRVGVCAWLPELTENTFLSGLRPRSKSGYPKSARVNSLLFRWTDPRLRGGKPPVRVMLVQDLTGLITARREKRDAIFGQMRQIYDGRLVKSTGMGEDLLWEGYLGMLGAVTPKYDEVAEINSILGERFVLYRPFRIDEEAEARKAANRGSPDYDWRADLADFAEKMFKKSLDQSNLAVVPDDAKDRLIDFAQLTATGRAAVSRDGYTKVIRFIPEPEGPARLTGQFLKFLKGLCTVRGVTQPGDEELDIIAKIARDSMPSIRLRLFRELYQMGGTKDEMAGRTKLPPSTIQYHLQDLEALGVATRSNKQWDLTEKYRDLCKRSQFFRGPSVNAQKPRSP